MKLTSALVSGTVCVVSALSASAHVGRGFAAPETSELLKARAHHFHGHGRIMARANPSSNAEMAKVQDPSQQCKAYGLPNSEELEKRYPKADQIADIVSGDDEGGKIFKEILDSGLIPENVKPKKGVENHMGVSQKESDSYNSDQDPDCWWTASGCTKPKGKKLVKDLTECPEPDTWGLTFDDGPNCSHNAFYDYLKEQKLKATLFYIGGMVLNWPLQAQRGLSDGHDICVHTWSHHYMTTLRDSQVFAELYYTMRIIKDVIGITPQCWRPPFGDVDDRVRAIAQGLGLRTIIWDNDTDDWNIIPSGKESTQKIDSNYEKIIKQGSNGTANDHGVVVLTHELTNETMSEFIRMYPKIKKAYKNVVPLTACFNATSPYVEDKPTYSTFSDFTNGKIDAKGLPDPSDMKVNVGSKITVTPEDKQADAGGFSPASLKKADKGDQSSGNSGSNSSDGDDSSNGNNSSGESGSGDNQTNDSQDKDSKGSSGGAVSISSTSIFVSLVISSLMAITLSA